MSDTVEYNARVEVLKSNDWARVIRVYPDQVKSRYLAGQYGSLGLFSSENPAKLLRRAYCLSSSIVDLQTSRLIDHTEAAYCEFYYNRVLPHNNDRENLSSKLFELKTGDRIFCGEKVVGHYTLAGVAPGKNVLFIGSTTGESPNNSLVNQMLSEKRKGKICHITVGPPYWSSLYAEEQAHLMKTYPQYRYLTINSETYASTESRIGRCLVDPAFSEDTLGFRLDPTTSHVFLSGDPALIGAPKKKGAWELEYPDAGLIRKLIEHNFSIRTKFKEGTIEYEAYW